MTEHFFCEGVGGGCNNLYCLALTVVAVFIPVVSYLPQKWTLQNVEIQSEVITI